MVDADRYCTVIVTPMFEAAARGILDEGDRRALENTLAHHPRAGVLIPGTGGFRKLRFARALRTEGKSGGARVIYYFVDRRDRVYLVLAYEKSRKGDLTRAEVNELRALAPVFEQES